MEHAVSKKTSVPIVTAVRNGACEYHHLKVKDMQTACFVLEPFVSCHFKIPVLRES
jgi:hypothetical protein